MTKLCIFGGTTVASYLGWWLADRCGCGFFGQLIWSGIASMFGVYAGWKLARKLDE
jgi:hypothetical protein